MADVQKIVDDLSALTVSEAAELAKMLEAKWSGAKSDGRLLFDDREERGRSRCVAVNIFLTSTIAVRARAITSSDQS